MRSDIMDVSGMIRLQMRYLTPPLAYVTTPYSGEYCPLTVLSMPKAHSGDALLIFVLRVW